MIFGGFGDGFLLNTTIKYSENQDVKIYSIMEY
jgi:hypothetical protein